MIQKKSEMKLKLNKESSLDEVSGSPKTKAEDYEKENEKQHDQRSRVPDEDHAGIQHQE